MRYSIFIILLVFVIGAFLIIKLEEYLLHYLRDLREKKVSITTRIIEEERKTDDLWQWLERLEEFECRQCPVDVKVLDRNGLYSYGCLQFQKPTFLEYLKKYYPETYKNLEGDEWLNLIWDCNFQKELAYKILKDNPQRAKILWSLSVVKGLGLPPTLK